MEQEWKHYPYFLTICKKSWRNDKRMTAPPVLSSELCRPSIQCRRLLPRQPFLCAAVVKHKRRWSLFSGTITRLNVTSNITETFLSPESQKSPFGPFSFLLLVLPNPNRPVLFTSCQKHGMRSGDGLVVVETDSYPVIRLTSRKWTGSTNCCLRQNLFQRSIWLSFHVCGGVSWISVVSLVSQRHVRDQTTWVNPFYCLSNGEVWWTGGGYLISSEKE